METLGLIAGGGQFPILLAKACKQTTGAKIVAVDAGAAAAAADMAVAAVDEEVAAAVATNLLAFER